MAEPILKWAGGKRQLMRQVLEHFPRDYSTRRFHEPMVGAGAVVFEVEPRAGSINDVNERLIRFYRTIRDYPDELISFNRKHRHAEDYYYQARARFNLPLSGVAIDPIEEASLLLFLNRTCFNGLYRVNSKGEFNVPFGGYKNPDFVQEERIRRISGILHRLEIFNQDFEYILNCATKGDLVYFDPPYHPTSLTSAFTAYDKSGFGIGEQIRLRDLIAKLDQRGVLVVLSNSAAPEMVEIYNELDGFTVSVVDARRSINCNGSKRGKVGELIVSNVQQNMANGGLIP